MATLAEINKQIEDKEALEITLADLKEKQSAIIRLLQSNQHSLAEKMNAVNGHEAAFKRSKWNQDEDTLNEAINVVEAEQAEMDANLVQKAEIITQIEAVKSELFALSILVTNNHLSKHQAKIHADQTELDRFDGFINLQQKIINGSQIESSTLPALNLQREELLGDMAAGVDRATEVKALDLEIEAEKISFNQDKKTTDKQIETASQTIAALNRRRSIVQSSFNELQKLTPKLLTQLAKSKAVQAAARYEKAAKDAITALAEISALDRITSELGESENTGTFMYRWDLRMPLLVGMESLPDTPNKELWFVDKNNINPLDAGILAAQKSALNI